VREERLGPTKFGPDTGTQEQEQEQMHMLDCLSSDRQENARTENNTKKCGYAYLVANKTGEDMKCEYWPIHFMGM
jgi:hypothetical protein